MSVISVVEELVSMVNRGMLSKEEAVLRTGPTEIERELHSRVGGSSIPRHKTFARGLAASPGAAVGRAVFDSGRAKSLALSGEKVILILPETGPEDVAGMLASQGILTSRGGKTSHAVIVARGSGIPCVAGAEEVAIERSDRSATAGNMTVREGDVVTLDGSDGAVYLGELPLVSADPNGAV